MSTSSDSTTQPTTEETTVDTDHTTDTAPEPEPTTEPDDTPEVDEGKEAAKYRRRLREAEKKIDTMTERLAAAQRTLIDHIATKEGRIKPEAFWAAGTQLDALLDDDGNIDTARVIEAANVAAHTLGLTRRPKIDPMQGYAAPYPAGNNWESAFRPK